MIKKMLNHPIVKYIIVGVLTTGINFTVFVLLKDKMDLTPANFVSIVCAIIFAYFANARFVFHSKAENFLQKLKELVQFFSARLMTMFVELVGVWFLVQILVYNDMVSKIVINIIVLILNYIFSIFIFHKK